MDITDVLFWFPSTLFMSGFVAFLYATYHANRFRHLRLQGAPLLSLLVEKSEVPEVARSHGRKARISLIIAVICYVFFFAVLWLPQNFAERLN